MERLIALVVLAGCAPERLSPLPFSTPEAVDRPPCAALFDVDPYADSGVYLVPGGMGARPSVFCNMDDEGGGWTLVAKVRRFPDAGYFGNEPRGFWQDGVVPDELLSAGIGPPDGTTTTHGIASVVGADIPVSDESVMWLELIHASGPDTGTRSWFKEVVSSDDLALWFGDGSGQLQTQVCRDAAMSNCVGGRHLLVDDGANLRFEGMRIAPAGVGIGLHMSLDGHPSGDVYSGVCTDTPNGYDDWPATANLDGHWGNGMRIWIR